MGSIKEFTGNYSKKIIGSHCLEQLIYSRKCYQCKNIRICAKNIQNLTLKKEKKTDII